MLEPDFTKYSLALVKDDKIIFSSEKSGLRPLFECVSEHKVRDCVLHDKVVGLAAAKVIVYSRIISIVFTDVCSKLAKEFLEEKNIEIKAKNIVDNILTEDKSSICPMEMKAKEIDGVEEFFVFLFNQLRNQ